MLKNLTACCREGVDPGPKGDPTHQKGDYQAANLAKPKQADMCFKYFTKPLITEPRKKDFKSKSFKRRSRSKSFELKNFKRRSKSLEKTCVDFNGKTWKVRVS